MKKKNVQKYEINSLLNGQPTNITAFLIDLMFLRRFGKENVVNLDVEKTCDDYYKYWKCKKYKKIYVGEIKAIRKLVKKFSEIKILSYISENKDITSATNYAQITYNLNNYYIPNESKELKQIENITSGKTQRLDEEKKKINSMPDIRTDELKTEKKKTIKQIIKEHNGKEKEE